jgi:hypothetical protein
VDAVVLEAVTAQGRGMAARGMRGLEALRWGRDEVAWMGTTNARSRKRPRRRVWVAIPLLPFLSRTWSARVVDTVARVVVVGLVACASLMKRAYRPHGEAGQSTEQWLRASRHTCRRKEDVEARRLTLVLAMVMRGVVITIDGGDGLFSVTRET